LLPSRVGHDSCKLANSWGLSISLAGMLVRLEEFAEREFNIIPGFTWPGIYIFSGNRSVAHNADVGGVEDSFHIRCPSLAADIRVGNVAGLSSAEVLAILGGKWRMMGGRWGGTFSDPSPNHFDIG